MTTQERLTAWSQEVLNQAAKLPPGPERDALIKRPVRPMSPATWMNGRIRRNCSHGS